MASHRGAGRAKKFGWTNVHVMSAGTEGWEKAGKPLKKT